MASDTSNNSAAPLHSADALTLAESFKITRAQETSVVLIAGSPGAGKTTLIAALFHCFQRGPFAGYYFAGSETCIGLDQRCHLSRTRSRGKTPDTERTKFNTERRLLHFRVRENGLKEEIKDILFSDISGEEFDEIRDDINLCREFALLKRADHLTLLVDGARLASPRERHAAKAETDVFLGVLNDSGCLQKGCSIHVLITKSDLISDNDAEESTSKFIEHIAQLYMPIFKNLTIQSIAARPEKANEDYHLGHGLNKVFPSWTSSRTKEEEWRSNLKREDLHTEFDRLLLRNTTPKA